MSDYHTYMGPYLRVENEVIRVTDGVGYGCVNEVCTMYHRAYVTPFCAQCGKVNADFEKPVGPTFKISIWEKFLEPIKEALSIKLEASYEKTISYLVPNHKRDGYPKYSTESPEHEDITQVTSEDITQDTAWFQSAFSEEISKAKEIFGADKVSVHWGRIVYYY